MDMKKENPPTEAPPQLSVLDHFSSMIHRFPKRLFLGNENEPKHSFFARCLDMNTDSSSHRQPFAGKVALVTGSSGGIGRATARALHRGGATVMLHAYRNVDLVGDLQTELEKDGGRAWSISGDLRESSFRKTLIEQCWRQQGRVDILIHAAGVDLMSEKMKKRSFDEKLQALWELDVHATIDLCRQFGERMRGRADSVILTLGWDGIERGMAGQTAQLYAAAKGAVVAFSRSLAHSLSPEVRVNCVSPGWIKTRWGEKASPRMQKRAERDSLLKRWGKPEEIAEILAFLASPQGKFLNAQNITANGGAANPTF
jgi:3-oxoacyl-[acyl-carrier protein] reductase